MIEFLRILATTIALWITFMSIFLFIRFRSRRWIYLVVFKMLDNSLSPYFALVGTVTVILGILIWAPVAILAGTIGTIFFAQYIFRVTKIHHGFEKAFGPSWLENVSPGLKGRMLPKRYSWLLPRTSKSYSKQEISFWTIAGSSRQLLCDIWRPSPDIPRSGLGLIYLHGSLWHYSDKDRGTRPLFSHRMTQGHVVMDVAYRLCPEVDLRGMLGDVKHAIAWMKANAGQYGVDPGKIVLAGGSAGAHLALLAAYTAHDLQFTPSDIQGIDLSVKGVVSYYGPPDLRAFFQEGFGKVNLRPEVEKIQRNLFGGAWENIPEAFRQSSPLTYVSLGCPATLICQGAHDMGIPVESTKIFYRKLADSGTPVVYVEFPQTDHGFDFQMRVLKLGDGSQYSPAAQASLYDLDRFLALQASNASG
jgi:acetyl esterase/lipase